MAYIHRNNNNINCTPKRDLVGGGRAMLMPTCEEKFHAMQVCSVEVRIEEEESYERTRVCEAAS